MSLPTDYAYFTVWITSYVLDVHPSSPCRSSVFSGGSCNFARYCSIIEPHSFKNGLTGSLTVLLIIFLLWIFFILTVLKVTFMLWWSRWLSCSRSKVKRNKMVCDKGHRKPLWIVTKHIASNMLCSVRVFPFFEQQPASISEKFHLYKLEVRCRSHQMYLCSHATETFKHFHYQKSAASSKSKQATEVKQQKLRCREPTMIKADIGFALIVWNCKRNQLKKNACFLCAHSVHHTERHSKTNYPGSLNLLLRLSTGADSSTPYKAVLCSAAKMCHKNESYYFTSASVDCNDMFVRLWHL